MASKVQTKATWTCSLWFLTVSLCFTAFLGGRERRGEGQNNNPVGKKRVAPRTKTSSFFEYSFKAFFETFQTTYWKMKDIRSFGGAGREIKEFMGKLYQVLGNQLSHTRWKLNSWSLLYKSHPVRVLRAKNTGNTSSHGNLLPCPRAEHNTPQRRKKRCSSLGSQGSGLWAPKPEHL